MRARPNPRRRGYAMVAVVLFVVLFLTLWGLAARQVGSMLRIEQARAARIGRDIAALPSRRALALGLAALEVGYPPSIGHECQVSIDGTPYALTFAPDPAATYPAGWIVTTATPADPALPALDPSQFSTAPPAPPSP